MGDDNLLTVKEASQWASAYLGKNVTSSNIAYLINYGRISKVSESGLVSKDELLAYYDSFSGKREVDWKEKLGDDLNWALSFEHLKEAETTKHVHRLHPYKGKFIPQLVEYFLDATRPLKPLTMKEVANALDIHESTVSRAVNGKYIETDNGIVEMRDFFVQSIVGTDGKEVANSQVKTRLKELVDQENKQKPLSDQKLSELLAEEGMEISRRTVAKYREELGILVSSKRKRFD